VARRTRSRLICDETKKTDGFRRSKPNSDPAPSVVVEESDFGLFEG